MNRRMSLATGLATLALCTVAACGTDDGPGTPEGSTPSPSASATTEPTEGSPSTPSASKNPSTAADLAGTWRDDAADWTVTFRTNGTFSEDFQGVPEFRTGTYEVTDGVVRLMGGDGNTTRGTVKDGKLVFKLGTLVKQ